VVTIVPIERGCVCWYDFGPADGSIPAKRRPVVVIQSDAYNRSDLRTTIVIPLTSQLRYARFDDNVFVPAVESGLPSDSVALAFQVTTVNKSALSVPVARLSQSLVRQIERGIQAVLGMGG
jgi:mRNA interferase MazF